ncbi:MAG: biotin--[acetyl-CoA-carboxylase] ligase [Pseudomonadota bacterium]
MPVPLDPRPIDGLIGWREAHLAQVGSTNEDLFVYAKTEENVDRLWLTAGQQMSGKGRRGRNWMSPVGNFHGSLYLSKPCEIQELGFFPLVCAVAVQRAIASVLESNTRQVQIKWPNDILVDGAKICGMLIEASHQKDHVDVVIGCGINLVAHPHDTPYPATNLKDLGANASTSEMLFHLASSFDEILTQWDRGNGNGTILQLWKDHARGIGEKTIVNLANGQIEGIFEGINANGVLLLREPSGKLNEISAGDIFYPHIS